MAGIPFTKGGPDHGADFEYHWKGPYLEAHFLSDVGKKRDHNEDSCLLCAPEDQQLVRTRGVLFAVADGMGGASAGEFASKLALQCFSEQLFSGPDGDLPEKLRQAVEYANEQVHEEAEGNPDYYGMGTTLSAMTVVGNCAYIAHVGDSRIYIYRNGMKLYQVTSDHSLVAEQLRGGFITEEEARHHSMKNLITRAIGIKDTVKTDLLGFYIQQGDTILICSDGLSNMVKDAEIQASLNVESLNGAARVLVGRALENGGTDNISVGVIRVTDHPPSETLAPGVVEAVVPKPGFLGRLKRLMA